MEIAGKEFDFNHNSYIMGILNVTPDSFSDGGSYTNIDSALKQTERMIQEGAAIIDVGGESTRPNHRKITDEEEIERVVPVIEAIKKNFDIVISLDTYKAKVAKAGLDAGVHMLNDIWGLKWDDQLAPIVAKADVPICLMHNRDNTDYQNVVEEVLDDLRESITIALQAGIKKDNIMLDPGIGFGKTYEQNLVMLKYMDHMRELGYPILLGTSRKSVIGLTLDLPVDQREEGTIATTVQGYLAGARIFRVHNVQANIRALRMIEAIERAYYGSNTN